MIETIIRRVHQRHTRHWRVWYDRAGWRGVMASRPAMEVTPVRSSPDTAAKLARAIVAAPA